VFICSKTKTNEKSLEKNPGLVKGHFAEPGFIIPGYHDQSDSSSD
jgi:hypothetical protein